MKNNLFDGYVKKQFDGFRPEVPPHVWEKIAGETGKRRPFFLGFTAANIAAALFAVLLTGGIIYFTDSKNTRLPEQAAKITSAQADQPTASVPPTAGENSSGNNTNETQRLENKADENVSTSEPQRLRIAGEMTAAIGNGLSDYTHPDLFKNDEFILKSRLSQSGLLASDKFFSPRVTGRRYPFSLAIPCPKIENDAAGNKRYVEIYASPDYAFRSFSDPTNAAYVQQRKASTSILFAYSAGMRYTRVFGSGMSVRAGLNYSQINESFKLVRGHVTQNVYITDAGGDTTGTYTVSGTQYKQSTNTFRSIDIPVTAGYEFGNGRLHTNISAGAVINVHSRQSGFVVDESGNPVEISTGKPSSVYQFKANAGVSFTAGVSVYYKVSEQLHVMAEPYFRYSLAPVTQNDLSLKQKYHIAGLRVGLRRDL